MDEHAEGVWGRDSVGLKVGRLESWFQMFPQLVKCPLFSDQGSLSARGLAQYVGVDLVFLVLFDCTSTEPLLIQHLSLSGRRGLENGRWQRVRVTLWMHTPVPAYNFWKNVRMEVKD